MSENNGSLARKIADKIEMTPALFNSLAVCINSSDCSGEVDVATKEIQGQLSQAMALANERGEPTDLFCNRIFRGVDEGLVWKLAWKNVNMDSPNDQRIWVLKQDGVDVMGVFLKLISLVLLSELVKKYRPTKSAQAAQ